MSLPVPPTSTGGVPTDADGAHERLDVALVARGLARSRARASQQVKDGRVHVDGVLASRPAQPVGPDATLTVDDAPDGELVSRAGGKLVGALAALDRLAATGVRTPGLRGLDCLDVGASTGGFTHVLLERGARAVAAIDVGHDQLVPELRRDPRVTVREGLNARELRAEDLPFEPALVVADLSFISLTLVLPAVRAAAPDAELLLMVKPQFEVGRARLGRGGVVRDPEHHVDAVLDVVACGAEHGARLRGVVASAVPGPAGNREFFCWFSPDAPHDPHAARTDAAAAVRAAVADSSGATFRTVGIPSHDRDGR
ncbi:TlyA family RNA methyltransferase [Sanguibacter sp. HDW7]|uniref:TlyA family RNA methyltransferase n=1 Tax=Sanguibacter sp. HDW7 TaxID=2714931 RepID=UPI001F0FCB69|nr:TlyA family RNA methyltransferase [Sanguibacter sp. HDW7]